MAEKQEPSVGVHQDQPATVQPAVLQDPSAFQPAVLAQPQWNYVLPGGVGQTFPAPVGQTFYPTTGQTFPPPGGVQPYGQPVVYYFDPGSGPVTQAPPPAARTDIVNPDDVITDYFVFVFVIAILCTAAAFPSILLGMPALFLAIKSRQFKTAGSYKMSQRYSVMSYYFGLGTVILGGAIFTIWVCILLWHRAFKPLF